MVAVPQTRAWPPTCARPLTQASPVMRGVAVDPGVAVDDGAAGDGGVAEDLGVAGDRSRAPETTARPNTQASPSRLACSMAAAHPDSDGPTLQAGGAAEHGVLDQLRLVGDGHRAERDRVPADHGLVAGCWAPAATRAVAAMLVRSSIDATARVGATPVAQGDRLEHGCPHWVLARFDIRWSVSNMAFSRSDRHGLDPERLGGQLPQGLADAGAGDDFPFGLGEREIARWRGRVRRGPAGTPPGCRTATAGPGPS